MAWTFNPFTSNFDNTGLSQGYLDTRYILKGGDTTTGNYIFTPDGTAIDGILINPTVTDPAVSKNALFANASFNATADTAQRMWGLRFNVYFNGTHQLTDFFGITGFEGFASYTSSANASGGIVGGLAYAIHAGSGTLDHAIGFNMFGNQVTGGGVLTTSNNLLVQSPFLPSGTIGTSYGIHISNQQPSGVSTGYGLYLDSQSGYALFTNTGLNFFGDDVIFNGNPYVYYGNYYMVDRASSWPSGTHRLIGVHFTSTDQTDIYTPGNSNANPVLSLGANNSVGFFNHALGTQGTSGANLTNNAVASGTTDQIDDFTSLTVYSLDAQAIHNDIYQLARKVKQINDSLRAYGLLT